MKNLDWKTTSQLYAAKLSSAIDLQRHALHLSNLPQAQQAGVKQEQIDNLKKAGKIAEKQKIRLEKNEFRIAVVGLEKAGKSTFINAWLEYDLLPANTERCTFTTTQIYSVKDDSEQRFETEPKIISDFNHYKKELIEQAECPDKSAAQKAKNDLDVIETHQKTLQEVLEEGKQSFRFTDFTELKPTLKKYVADERYAHAMREARLYTSKLAAIDGVVFYDVPGLDSGLSKHIEESKEMLSDCDAIILVQRRDISLKAYEQDLIRFGESGDPYLKLADKLFVFWGQIDLQPSLKVLNEDWKKLLNIWEAEGIPAKRIIRGSAGAHLVLNDFDIPKIGTSEQVREKMAQLTNINANDIEKLKQATGIAELKNNIKNYLDSERTILLEKRCNSIIADIVNTSQDIYKIVGQHYPEDPEQAKRRQEQDNTVDFQDWWKARWKKTQGDVNKITKTYLDDKSNDIFEKFLGTYRQSIQQRMETIPSRQPDERQIIFNKNSIPVFDATQSNFAWREALYQETRKILEIISDNMATGLVEEAHSLMDDIKKELWNTTEVERRLINNKRDYKDKLERSFNTLFMRFARPIVEILIRKPVGSEARNAIFDSLDADSRIIDNYIKTDEPALKRVGRYATHGFKLFTNPDLRTEILGASVAATRFVLRRNFLANIALDIFDENFEGDNTATLSTHDQLILEVESDLQALEHFLLQGVFDAAGFKVFREQELAKLRDDFLEKDSTWSGVAINEWKDGNPLLLQELPVHLRTQTFDTEVSNRLHQLGIALRSSLAK